MISSLLFAQTEGESIDNVWSDLYEVVEGTKVSLIRPQGFVTASNFSGFMDYETSSSIMLSELPASISELDMGFTVEALASKGMKLISKVNFKLNGYDAMMFTIEQASQGYTFTKYMLLFGNNEFAVMINATFLPENAELGENLKKSILGSIYDSKLQVNYKDVIDFEIEVSDTKLQFADMISKSLMFTVDGNIPSRSNDQTLFIIGSSISEDILNNKKEFALERLENYPNIEVEEIKAIKEVSINGLDGYEIEAIVKDTRTDKTELMYQVFLYEETSYHMMVGLAVDKFEENLALFKKISNTFKMK